VWTDRLGDRLFSRLKGDPLETGRRVVGTITGGTGRYAGLEASTHSSGSMSCRPRTARSRAAPCASGACAPEGDDAVTAPAAGRNVLLARGAVITLASDLVLSGARGLVPAAWHLFALFVAAIVSVVIGAFPILTASVLASPRRAQRTLAPAKAYSGFANGTILLIVVAFLVARAVVKCGLGERLGHLVVSAFGRSTLGLGYSVFLVDGVIAPAFPSNTPAPASSTARTLGGRGGGSASGRGEPESPRPLPHVLGMASLTVSSACGSRPWPEPARRGDRPGYGLDIGFAPGSSPPRSRLSPRWPPAARPLQVVSPSDPTPEAPRAARGRSRSWAAPPHEKIVAATFAGMVGLWAAAATLGLDSTAIAFLGLGVLLTTGVLTSATSRKKGTCSRPSSGSPSSSP